MWVLMLDDQRSFSTVKIPEKYDCFEKVLVKSYGEFVDIINKRGLPQAVFLDHDLGVQSYREGTRTGFTSFNYNNLNGEYTGYDAAKFIINYCEENKKRLPKWFVHSMNPVGRQNIIQLLKKYENEKKQNHDKSEN